jgi:hypothetical protein
MIVLFGRNDAGKTNIIEALAQFAEPWTSPEDVREDSLTPQATGYGIRRVEFELDGRDVPKHPDRLALRDLVTTGHSWLVPDQYQPGWSEHRRHELRLVGDEWVALDPDRNHASDLGEFLRRLAESAHQVAARDELLVGNEEAFALLVAACLRSRWLAYESGSVMWLAPLAEEVEERERVAAETIALSGVADRLPLRLGEVARAIASRSPRRTHFLELYEDQDTVLTPFRIVRLLASQPGIVELEQTVQRELTAGLLRGRGLPLHDASSAPTFGFPDPWFVADDAESERLNPDVAEIAARISARATEAAPAFVRNVYDIVVEVLRPSRWWFVDGRRLRLTLRTHGAFGASFPFTVAGTGIALWAGYAVAEALGELRKDDHDPRRVLYLIDEPERHLHPTAQVEAAAFLARLAREDADIVVATHAAAFIDTPLERAALVRVHRDGDWVTRAEDISGDLLRALRADLETVGLTVADLLQLTRGVLLVEGQHDKKIVESLFAGELARARLIVMPLRGAHETLAILDADLLRSLGKPLAVMLDNTRSEFVAGLRSGVTRIAGDASSEERQLKKLAELLERTDRDLVREIPFDAPDVICALPEQAVMILHPVFRGWRAERAISGEPGAYKRAVEAEIGRQVDGRWIDRVLVVAAEHRLTAEPILQRAISEVLAFLNTSSDAAEGRQRQPSDQP